MHSRSWTPSSVAALPRAAATKNLWARRATLLQRLLNFLDVPIPEIQIWEMLENEPRTLAVEVLARLIIQATWVQKPEGSSEN
jgi:hypothetical protein